MRDVTRGPGRLVVKAAMHYSTDPAANPRQRQLREDRLELLGEVAADVFGLCHTATAFQMAVRDALEHNPLPNLATSQRKVAESLRNAWTQVIAEVVLTELERW